MSKKTSLLALLTGIFTAGLIGHAAAQTPDQGAGFAGEYAYVLLAIGAFLGGVLLVMGISRIMLARAERRQAVPTNHYSYGEGVSRVAIGLGLIATGCYALLL